MKRLRREIEEVELSYCGDEREGPERGLTKGISPGQMLPTASCLQPPLSFSLVNMRLPFVQWSNGLL